jgi:hypothetical protein
MNSTIFHYYNAHPFLELQCSIILRCYIAKSFSIAHYSVIFYCYNAHPFFTITVLTHSSCKRSSIIHRCYSTQPFSIVKRCSVILQCYNTQSFSLLHCSVITRYYSARGRSVILQNDRAWSRSRARAGVTRGSFAGVRD